MYSFYVSKCVLETVTFLHDVCHPKVSQVAVCCTLLEDSYCFGISAQNDTCFQQLRHGYLFGELHKV